MATNDVHPDQVESAARALLDERMDSIRALTHTHQQVLDHRAALSEAERAHATAHAHALRGGWTQEELKKLGFAETVRKAPGRPRRPRQTTPAPAPTTPARAETGHDADSTGEE